MLPHCGIPIDAARATTRHNGAVNPSGLETLRRPPPRTPRAGDLLVAAPALVDPNFRKTLVYVLQHDDEGSAGVVVNRPATVDAADMDLPSFVSAAPVMSGGPVATDSVLVLAAVDSVPESLRGPCGPDICVVDLDADAGAVTDPLPGMRVFIGYAGWSAGQLAGEIARADWHVVPATADDVLAGDPATAWPRVLRRQRDTTRLWSTLPALPAAN
jgi:putative transcriptional regulator